MPNEKETKWMEKNVSEKEEKGIVYEYACVCERERERESVYNNSRNIKYKLANDI